MYLEFPVADTAGYTKTFLSRCSIRILRDLRLNTYPCVEKD